MLFRSQKTNPTGGSTNDTWNVFVATNGQLLPSATTQLTFDNKGLLSNTPAMTISASDLQAAGVGNPNAGGVAVDLTKATEFGTDFSINNVTQDGYSPGQRTGVAIDAYGNVTVNYSNGQSKLQTQIGLWNFNNDQGLKPVGNNDWKATTASGDPIPGTPGAGGLGAIQSGALEESNVDLTAELVNMITAQREYQANAQTIKTLDQVMQTLVSLR